MQCRNMNNLAARGIRLKILLPFLFWRGSLPGELIEDVAVVGAG